MAARPRGPGREAPPGRVGETGALSFFFSRVVSASQQYHVPLIRL